MRAKLILLLTAAALAACGSATSPDESGTGALNPAAASVPDAPKGGGGSGGAAGPAATGSNEGGPLEGVSPPCLQAVRLASDLLPGPVSCRR
jgi:hypothetical protein